MREQRGDVARQQRELLRIPDVATMADCSEDSVRRWIALGELEVVRLPGRLVRIQRKDLERFLKRHVS